MIAADELGVDIDDILVLHGDTSIVQYGIGTFGSRGIDGTWRPGAVLPRSRIWKAKVKKFGAMLLDSDDFSYSGGQVICNKTGASKALAEIAGATYRAMKLPPNTEPGLIATHFLGSRATLCFPFGAHIVWSPTSTRDIGSSENFAATSLYVDDCGNILNPPAGGWSDPWRRGAGPGAGAVREAVRATRADSSSPANSWITTMPRAHMMPWIESERITTTPTTVNPLGVKGVGEAGKTTGASPAVVNLGSGTRYGRTWECAISTVFLPYDARKNLEADREEKLMIVARKPFDYSAPKTLDEAMKLVAAGAKPPGRR